MKLQWSVVWQHGHEYDESGSLSPHGNVWIELLRSAVLWPVLKTAQCGMFSNSMIFVTEPMLVPTVAVGQTQPSYDL